VESFQLFRRFVVPVVAALLTLGCSSGPPQPTPASSDPDPAKAADQARTFHTLATPDDWGNYGEQFTRFCTVKFNFDCNREDRDVGSGLDSAEEVSTWDAEKNNPQSVLADIGILFTPQAAAVGVLSDYEPPSVDLLPDDLHAPGWVATFTGVPTLLVNVDALEARGVAVPESWEDLTKPEYASLVGMGGPGVSASSTWAFVAMNLAAGGTADNWQPAIDYGRRLLPNITQSASLETFSRGEVPIAVRFDFQHARWKEDLVAEGIEYRVVVPAEGSVYAPATLMMNGHDKAHADFAKMFLDWVLTDEGQLLFAKFGSRPIRSVVGDNKLAVPDELKGNWVPDDQYTKVEYVDWQTVDSEEIADMWANQVVGGG
jgi:putative spermidine/putrescine transport system substrate-binding protein